MAAVDISKLRVDDIVVAVMGPTGCGKSNLIDTLTPLPRAQKRASDGLASYTKDVRAVRVLHHVEYGDRLVLVDTPGFNDTERSDMEILEIIGDWLRKTYRGAIKLAGIIYLHRITDNRMAGSPMRNLRMFGELCGDRAAHKVVLVTTMWDKIEQSPGEKRESELEYRYFKELLRRGALLMRFNNTYRAAWDIIEAIIAENEKEAVLIQEELVELGHRLNETSAGKALYNQLQNLLSEQKRVVVELTQLAKIQNNKKLASEMHLEYKRIQKEFESSFGAISKLKISLGRRLVLLLGKKSRARSLSLVHESSGHVASPAYL
ncbi:P-loop containing nucleoside triphosphate hydrolase protein [Crepidotus variabilis]|uniref:P-loop containing nucleoside triphosphate hydrolase protein n=1 Tax=Crepidotus variabilis TaxID=179855 RepID=A0A9P6EGB9_9AGAR|nr:P-loop containing nucleoside triphosphate hydrolase protein [Crepidotus variabilis]